MSKSYYAGYLSVPSATTDPIVGSPNTGVGGDIVANFKAIGDIIGKSSKSYTGCSVASTGCQANGTYTTVLGSQNLATAIPHSINTIRNGDYYVSGVTGLKGMSNGQVSSSFYSEGTGIEIYTTGYAIFDIEAIYVDQSHNRSNAHYRVVVDYSNYPATVTTTLLHGTDASVSSRFSVSNSQLYINNPDGKMYFVLNIHYTVMTNAQDYSSYDSYDSYYSS